MALDWSKEISFSGLRRRSVKAKSTYPEKTWMNLVSSDRQTGSIRRNALSIVLVTLSVVLFVKFGIFDFYARVADKSAELSARQQTLAMMSSAIGEYDEVLAEYESYESTSMMGSGLVVEALDALSLVDQCVAPYASVASLTLDEDTLSLKLTGTTLDKLGQLVASLEAQDIVANTHLSTAASQQSESGEVTATVTVTLQAAIGGGEGQ